MMNNLSKNKFLAYSFIAIAIISLIFSIICFSKDCGYFANYETYGGDAYTGIQNASAKTANNVKTLTYQMLNVAGMAFLVVTFIFLALGVSKLLPEDKTSKNTEPTDTTYKTCPNCGKVVTTKVCSFCGNENNLFE